MCLILPLIAGDPLEGQVFGTIRLLLKGCLLFNGLRGVFPIIGSSSFKFDLVRHIFKRSYGPFPIHFVPHVISTVLGLPLEFPTVGSVVSEGSNWLLN